MDDLVVKAMLKWPNVPDCHGWLGLDERGDWYMRDAQTQARGSFKSGCLLGDKLTKGSKLEHEKLIAFIGRNYGCETHSNGQESWFFQNGPQKVYVDLAATPYIWRLEVGGVDIGPTINSHTGLVTDYRSCYLDCADRLYIVTTLGLGLVHTLDMHIAADAIEQGYWTLEPEKPSEAET